jgi:DNA uptake protein ComE-like DNA-binding protein
MAKAQLNVTVALSKEKVADMIEQVLLGQDLAYESGPNTSRGSWMACRPSSGSSARWSRATRNEVLVRQPRL